MNPRFMNTAQPFSESLLRNLPRVLLPIARIKGSLSDSSLASPPLRILSQFRYASVETR